MICECQWSVFLSCAPANLYSYDVLLSRGHYNPQLQIADHSHRAYDIGEDKCGFFFTPLWKAICCPWILLFSSEGFKNKALPINEWVPWDKNLQNHLSYKIILGQINQLSFSGMERILLFYLYGFTGESDRLRIHTELQKGVYKV